MEETSPEQQTYSTNSKRSILRGNGDSKWETWLRIFLSFAFGAISTAFLLGGKSRDLGALLEWKSGLEARDGKFAQYDARFERMDREGTNKSKQTDQYQSEQISANLARIVEAEKKLDQISVMQGKIERLDGEVKDLKEANRK